MPVTTIGAWSKSSEDILNTPEFVEEKSELRQRPIDR
jgi:hypothetical protein